MRPFARLPNPPKSLPQALGPKLAPFTPTAYADIEFIEQLGDPSSNKDGHVWKVKINGTEPFYALKMFHFNPSAYLEGFARIDRALASRQLYVDFLDLFNCECRVYGRLKQENREDLTVRAHGYLFLTPQQEIEITGKIRGIEDPPTEEDANMKWEESMKLWRRQGEDRHLPVRAIVKEFVPNATPFRPEHVSSMWSDLESLHELGILVRDVKVFNYLDGKLVDFSRAWTVPHPSLEHLDPQLLQQEFEADPIDFEGVVVEWSLGNYWAEGEGTVPDGVRDCIEGRGRNGFYGADPRNYDWRKWEKDPAAAETFMARKLFSKKKYI